jgi:hypothetical protein
MYEAPEVNVVQMNSQSEVSLTLSAAQAIYNKTSAQKISSANVVDF